MDFSNQQLGIAKPAAAPPPAPIVRSFAPPTYPVPIPNPFPKPAPVPPPPRTPLPPAVQLGPPSNFAGELLGGGGVFGYNWEMARLTWKAPKIQPQSTTYEIYIERDMLTRLPNDPPVGIPPYDPDLIFIEIHKQGIDSYYAYVSTGPHNRRLAAGETVRYWVVARCCPNNASQPIYNPGLFGIKLTLRRPQGT